MTPTIMCTILVPHSSSQFLPELVLDAVVDIAPNWMLLGFYLQIPYHVLQTIRLSSATCQIHMLTTLNEWVVLKGRGATIQNFIVTVRSKIKSEVLAQYIENDPIVEEWFKGKIYIMHSA